MVAFSYDDIIANIQLARTENVGPISFQHLRNTYGTAQDALKVLPELAARGGRKRKLKPLPIAQAKTEFEQAEAMGGRILILGDDDYPYNLTHIYDPPPLITAYGALDLCKKQCLAVVGSRNASITAQKITRNICATLSAKGIIIVSGLARGIDSCAHDAALAGGTIAVIANGIDISYPKDNAALQAQIRESGLILTEHPPGTKPLAQQFPRRNRIVSGLSLGALVIEAKKDSGSLITAKLAADQGREVMAVPFAPEARSHGSNLLLKTGATVIQTAEDVLHEIESITHTDMFETRPQKPIVTISPQSQDISPQDRNALLSLLSPSAVHIDELIRHSGLPVPVVNVVLIELELAGRLSYDLVGGGISLIPSEN